jgi:hypothetical protein
MRANNPGETFLASLVVMSGGARSAGRCDDDADVVEAERVWLFAGRISLTVTAGAFASVIGHYLLDLGVLQVAGGKGRRRSSELLRARIRMLVMEMRMFVGGGGDR